MARPGTPRREITMSRSLVAALGLVAILGTVAISAIAAGDGSLPWDWQRVRAVVACYHSFERPSGTATAFEQANRASARRSGRWNIHATNAALKADGVIDPLRPEILLYVPGKNGLKLVGVEYWKADADGESGDRRPTVRARRAARRPDARPQPDHAGPLRPPGWVAEQNPSGLFAQFNPTVRC